jgi:hypothetical protein
MYIRPSFVNNCLTNLLSGSTPHHLPCVKVQYIQKVIGCEGGVLSPVGDHILQELNALYLTRFRTYKIARPPEQKPRREEGLRQINTCREVPLQVYFFR